MKSPTLGTLGGGTTLRFSSGAERSSLESVVGLPVITEVPRGAGTPRLRRDTLLALRRRFPRIRDRVNDGSVRAFDMRSESWR